MNLSADVCRESLSLLVCSRATVEVRTHSLRMLPSSRSLPPLRKEAPGRGGTSLACCSAGQATREMSNCRGTYAFLTYLVAFSKLAAPRRKKRQVVSLLLRKERVSLSTTNKNTCALAYNGAADAECCHLPGVRSAAAAPISLCASPLFHSGLQPSTVPGGRGGRASRIIGIFRNLWGLKCHYCF